MLENHVREIEKLEFQIQFVALSGLSVLQLVLSKHKSVTNLLDAITCGRVGIQELHTRILHLLLKVDTQRELSYDGSIVVYLYCLSKFDLDMAQNAGLEIFQVKGLFWSRRLARQVNQIYTNRQVKNSFSTTSDVSQSTTYEQTVQDLSFELASEAAISTYSVSTEELYPECQVEFAAGAREAA